MHRYKPISERPETLTRSGERFRIPVQPEETGLRRQRTKQRFGVTASSHRGVQVDARSTNHEPDHLIDEDRFVIGGSVTRRPPPPWI
jgi:hypothetical protein